jgi:hypothetical protein
MPFGAAAWRDSRRDPTVTVDAVADLAGKERPSEPVADLALHQAGATDEPHTPGRSP